MNLFHLWIVICVALGNNSRILLRDQVRPGLDVDSDEGSLGNGIECHEPGGHVNTQTQECVCCPGFFGTGCTMRNVCHTQICLNDGTCDAQTGLCICSKGFLGTHCEIPDCGDNGSFNPFRGECACRRGWSGYRCEQCALPSRSDLEMICVPVIHGDYVLLEVSSNVATDLISGAENPLGQSYHAIRPAHGKGVIGHDGRHYGCDCRPIGEIHSARQAHMALRTSASDLGEFDTVISDCITNSNLTSQQMQDLNELWNRCIQQERLGRLNDTWYIVGVIFIILFIVALVGLVISCFLWSSQLDTIQNAQMGQDAFEQDEISSTPHKEREIHIGKKRTKRHSSKTKQTTFRKQSAIKQSWQ